MHQRPHFSGSFISEPLSISGSPGGVFFFFDGRDLFHAALMPAAGKLRGQPFIHDAKSFVGIEDASAQRKNVGIVMLAAHLGFIFSAYVCGANTVNFVSRDRHANAAAADQDAKIGALLTHVMGHRAGVVRVVYRFRRGGAFVADLNALLLKVLLDLVFQLVACVIGAHCDFHGLILLKCERQKWKSRQFAPASFVTKLSRTRSLFVFVSLARFHARFHMVNGCINRFDGLHAMAALIMLGFFQMVLGRLQGFKRSLHVWLIVVIIACDGSDGNAKETQNNR